MELHINSPFKGLINYDLTLVVDFSADPQTTPKS